MSKNLFDRRTGPYRAIARAMWDNRDQPAYAWRILNDGVCDGCALGTSGMKDWTIDGIHLCWIRLNLLRLNTMPAFADGAAADCERLEQLSERELRSLGRIPHPLIRRRGDSGFSRLSWDEALTLAGSRLRSADPERIAFYMVARGTLNETYYVAQKVARFLGTNHVDNSARVCHSPSTVALKRTVGFAATTCSYKDLLEADLIVLFGSDIANNQPVAVKYLEQAKSRGARVLVVNPYREPGLEKYWVPSSVKSALLGTKIADVFFQVQVGGDIAFIHGVLKHLESRGWLDDEFIKQHTNGWVELSAALGEQSFDTLEALSGVTQGQMLEFARSYAKANKAIFIWSMGITMHRHGVDNVCSIANLALARGMVGRPGSGLMAIRGHSGVQGGAEMGCVPNQLPGGLPLEAGSAGALSRTWGFDVPDWRGYFVSEMVEAAADGNLDVLYCAGSNLLGVLPEPEFVRRALGKIPLRIHHDIVLNPQMLVGGETVLVLPATTRYEVAGGGTETTTERRIIFNPEIPGRRIPEARDEWRVLVDLAGRARPDLAGRCEFANTEEIRREISEVVPFYRGIEQLARKGDQFQWGGRLLAADGRFGFPDGRARFARIEPPAAVEADGKFRLNTRRGRQFNSMVFSDRDMLVGARRDAVVLAPEDCERLELEEGEAVTVRSPTGQIKARVKVGAVRPGTAMMYWPEANVLIPRGVLDPECGIPAFRSTLVEVVPGSG
ncbi:MAG: FdhF/YdeP family oxidoreductase [Acidobacteria bacterium]|nr:FdhF/YdeP family oxidoreductase [Acidobacteriota bacterium]